MKTEREDLEQELLILIWENVETYNDIEFYKAYHLKVLERLFYSFLVKEHKEGLWITDSIFKATNDNEFFDVCESDKSININEATIIMNDAWLEEYYEKRRESCRKWREKNQYRLKDLNHKYYMNAREKKLRYAKLYRTAHRDEINSKVRDYYYKHKEEKAIYNKKYKAENKEKISEYNKRYLNEHREEINARKRKKRKEQKEQKKEKCV